jgi:hypothetical protein
MNLTGLWHRIFDHIGWPGVLGVVLLLLAGGITLSVVQSENAQLVQLQTDALSLKTRIEQAARSGLPETASQDDLSRFHDFFDGPGATHWLDALYAAAAAQNLVLTRGEYRMTADRNGTLARYQITLPIQGSYLQIRRFVAQALTDVPVASLDDIRFKRDSIAATQLEATIKLTLYLNADGAGMN